MPAAIKAVERVEVQDLLRATYDYLAKRLVWSEASQSSEESSPGIEFQAGELSWGSVASQSHQTVGFDIAEHIDAFLRKLTTRYVR